MPRIPVPERRSALVHAALRVVAERGVTAATTRAIVAEAGMSLASFHYAFSSRDELMAELIRYVVSQEEVAILGGGDRQDLPVGGSIRDYVFAGLRGYLDLLHRDPMREKAMLELTQYALRSPGMAFLAQEQYDHYFVLAASALEHAADLSGCEWNRPVEDVARLLVAITDGLTVAWLVNEDDTAAISIIECAADAVAGLARTA